MRLPPHLPARPAAAVALLLVSCLGLIAQPPVEEEGDPPEVALGERLFLETRFAQAFKAYLDRGHGVNNPESAEDPVMETTATPSVSLPGPFRGASMNCRACHLVDEHASTEGAGMRSYADFARKSPVPLRAGDPLKTAPRNSPSLVNASLPRQAFVLHHDGEFATIEDLVRGTFTGRNLGWLPSEEAAAIAHLARIVREDNGQGDLAAEFGNLSYARVLAGLDPSIPHEFRLPPAFRLNVHRATDEEILDAVAALVAAYVRQLEFARDEHGEFHASPFDVFLKSNGLPLAPAPEETPSAYSTRLLDAVNALDRAGNLQLVAANPETEDGAFKSHAQLFRFGSLELAGFRVFFSGSSSPAPAATELAAGAKGNCVACHPAPAFTDFSFHNTGATQSEYDAIHGDGAFAQVPIPGLSDRNSAPALYLPATGRHPHYAEPFRSSTGRAHPEHVDLGLWNIYANPDMPAPQPALQSLLCRDVSIPLGAIGSTSGLCSPFRLLDAAIARFKTPGLRDLGHSAPYLHNGIFDSLEDVVAFYRANAALARAGTLRNAAPELRRVVLAPGDTAALAAFLRALNEDYE